MMSLRDPESAMKMFGAADMNRMMNMFALAQRGCWKGMAGKGKGGKTKQFGDRAAKGGKGKAALKMAAGETPYVGQVSSFVAEKNHGYISCQAVLAMCGQEIYAFREVLERGEAGPGDTVCCFLHWSSRCQAQASSPLIRLAAGDGGCALKGVFKPGGTDKSFGFLECDETMEFFGRDVYVNKDIAANLIPGQHVSFNAYLNRDGMPNAHNAVPCDESWRPTPGDLSCTRSVPVTKDEKGRGGFENAGGMEPWWPMMGMIGLGVGSNWGPEAVGWDGGCGNGSGWGNANWNENSGGDWSGWSAGSELGDGLEWNEGDNWCQGGVGQQKGLWGWGKGGRGKGGRPTPTGRFYVGVIKSFNEVNNYGFLSCDELKSEFENDVFCHGSRFQGHAVGETVMFELGISSKGQPQAINVQSMDISTLASISNMSSGEMDPPLKRQRLSGDAIVQDDESQALSQDVGGIDPDTWSKLQAAVGDWGLAQT